MRLLRYFLVPWTIIFVYSFFSFVFGQNGIYAQKHLQAEKYRLSENQKKLETAYNNFQNTKENLMKDMDSLSVYTRQLGYGRSDEEFIRIMGLGVALNADLPAGQVMYAVSPAFIHDKTIKIISIFFGVLVLVFLLILDINSFKNIQRQ